MLGDGRLVPLIADFETNLSLVGAGEKLGGRMLAVCGAERSEEGSGRVADLRWACGVERVCLGLGNGRQDRFDRTNRKRRFDPAGRVSRSGLTVRNGDLALPIRNIGGVSRPQRDAGSQPCRQ